MTSAVVPFEFVANKLSSQDDPKLWVEVLTVISEEFLQQYRAKATTKESWYLRIGACSHWVRPHQSRWTAAGGFAWPVGYKGAASLLSRGLPEFDWSVKVAFDGERWTQVERFVGKKQIVLRVAVPARTVRHKQAALHTMWSTSHQTTFYGFRNRGERWICVAASDELKEGRIAIRGIANRG